MARGRDCKERHVLTSEEDRLILLTHAYISISGGRGGRRGREEDEGEDEDDNEVKKQAEENTRTIKKMRTQMTTKLIM